MQQIKVIFFHQLFQSVTILVRKALYECVQDQSDASELFPGMNYIIYNDYNL